MWTGDGPQCALFVSSWYIHVSRHSGVSLTLPLVDCAASELVPPICTRSRCTRLVWLSQATPTPRSSGWRRRHCVAPVASSWTTRASASVTRCGLLRGWTTLRPPSRAAFARCFVVVFCSRSVVAVGFFCPALWTLCALCFVWFALCNVCAHAVCSIFPFPWLVVSWQLGKRDYVTGRMWKHAKAPYRLILNTAARKQINWHCEHYASRGAVACSARSVRVPSR